MYNSLFNYLFFFMNVLKYLWNVKIFILINKFREENKEKVNGYGKELKLRVLKNEETKLFLIQRKT